MKPALKYALLGAGAALLLTVFILGRIGSGNLRHITTCHSLEVIITDSLQRRFVSREDVRDYLRDYGDYKGQRLDSVDLCRMETILEGKSAIKKSDCYLTDDGTLHVLITQRAPVVRFQKGAEGFYSDETGFIFPLHKSFTSMVPVIDGDIPIQAGNGFKGEPRTEAEREWLRSVLALVERMKGQGGWEDVICQISVGKGGNITMIPREGPELFLFGQPSGIEGKFSRMRKYYETIAPLEKEYTIVDVRNEGQIVCRK